ncbi:hypothetical protein RJ641_010004 [Dillenia turbinata]|uniref:Cation-transporting P-type ATPase N-terminal domain-containing protein n=1 Tax=Dillenia turbinata TaxID=194707 RepID=A0AAN8Z2A2_9MAGN
MDSVMPSLVFFKGSFDGGSRTEEEEVYSWLYAIAQSDKVLVYKYVRSTERGLSFTEADWRLKENGPNAPHKYTFPSWWHLLWIALFHPFNIILIVLSILSYITDDIPNGCIMMVLVLISVSLRFYQAFQEYSSSKAAMRLSELVRCPVKVQRCAGRVVQTELVVQVDQRDVVTGDIAHFEPRDLFPGDVRLLTSRDLVSSLTGKSGTTEKVADIKEDGNTPLLDLKNICFMVSIFTSCPMVLIVISYQSLRFYGFLVDFLGGVATRTIMYLTAHLIMGLIPILLDYFGFQLSSLDIIFLSSAWANSRGGKTYTRASGTHQLNSWLAREIYDIYEHLNVNPTPQGAIRYGITHEGLVSFPTTNKGTSVVSGIGTGLFVSTGSKTYMSTIFSTIGKRKPPDDFEKGVRRISYVLIAIMLVMVTIIVLCDYFTSKDLGKSVLFGISVASALTPQMLPLIVNTSLAIGALAMARDRCIVKSLAAICDMGSINNVPSLYLLAFVSSGYRDILCTDKTGTLTTDKTEQKNPIDNAILAYVYTNGYRFQPSKWRKINEIPFDFIRRRVSIILEEESMEERNTPNTLRRYMVTKGALEEVMKVFCFIQHVDRGAITKFSSEDYQRIQSIGEILSNDGLRVLAVAMKKLKTQTSHCNVADEQPVESDMVFLGLITFFDPPKDSAKQALWQLAEKGVKSKVLTCDTLALAIKVCKEVGIRTTEVITGPELELLDNDAFHETVKRVTVLARLTPTKKLRVVQSLQTVGKHVVGFLGDGVNDSLALDAANVGVKRGHKTCGNTMKYIKMAVIDNIGNSNSLGEDGRGPCENSAEMVSPKGLLLFFLWNGPVYSLCDIITLLFLWFYLCLLC